MAMLLYSVVSWIGYDKLSLTGDLYAPTTPEGQYEDVSFPSRGQNYQVKAFFEAGKEGMPALIVVHGYRGTRYDQHNRDKATAFRRLGYTILAVDLSDNGGSTIDNGRISMGYSERWDVLGGFDYLLTRGFTADEIGLVGESMGAATSLLAAALEPHIRAVWEDSGYTSAPVVVGEQAGRNGFPAIIVPGGLIIGRLRVGDRIDEAVPIDAAAMLAANKTTIQIVHCEQDETVAPHHAPDLFQAYQQAGVKVDFWLVGCHKHAGAFDFAREDYTRRLDAFFRGNLTVN
ncbi:MAG: alpha/beta hydrolase [Anaerolineae bacterium]|nr:alpha/beta hydrolase [Anaerolineae bacterium]